MNVLLIMETVVNCALTLEEATTVHAILVLCYMMMATCVLASHLHTKFDFKHYIIDIDECAKRTVFCEQSCHNTEGSYMCDCEPGYHLVNNVSCADINECNYNNGGCDHTCINQEGSYNCLCDTGYTLEEDGLGCSGCYNLIWSTILYYLWKSDR